MHFTHYQITRGKVFAVNPFISPDGYYSVNSKFHAFETWLSTQPEITADPSIKDGVYKFDELEIDYAYNIGNEGKKEWCWCPKKTYDQLKSNGVGYSEFLACATLKQPEQAHEIEANCNGCGKEIVQGELYYTVHNGDDYCKDCYEAIQSDDESSGRFDALKQPVKQEEKPVIKTDKIYRPHWVNEDHLKALGYELVSDKDGYIKYQSSFELKAKHREGRTFEQLLGNGKRFIYFNCTYVPQDDLVFCCIREDADTRTVYNGVLTEASQLELILKLVE